MRCLELRRQLRRASSTTKICIHVIFIVRCCAVFEWIGRAIDVTVRNLVCYSRTHMGAFWMREFKSGIEDEYAPTLRTNKRGKHQFSSCAERTERNKEVTGWRYIDCRRWESAGRTLVDRRCCEAKVWAWIELLRRRC